MNLVTSTAEIPLFIAKCREICPASHTETGPSWHIGEWDWGMVSEYLTQMVASDTLYCAYNNTAALMGVEILDPTLRQKCAYELFGRSSGSGLMELRNAFHVWAAKRSCHHVLVQNMDNADTRATAERASIMTASGFNRLGTVWGKSCR